MEDIEPRENYFSVIKFLGVKTILSGGVNDDIWILSRAFTFYLEHRWRSIESSIYAP